jgi:hypothetical protein
MKTYLDCIPCFVQQALDAARMVTDDEDTRLRIMRRVLKEAAGFPEDACPPVMGTRIHRIIRRMTGNPDPYRDIKHRSNEFALEMMPEFEKAVSSSDDPFETAMRLAIAGNILDWGAKPHTDISEESARTTLRASLHQPLHPGSVQEVRRRMAEATDILYLADNAGEIVLDRLFIQHMPASEVTVAVKSQPAINDATMADAIDVELTDIVPVIETGSDTPGTVLEECSEEFLRRFTAADLVVAKGQGNYEALSERPEEIVFLLKAKCTVVARDLGCEQGDLVLLHRNAPKSVESGTAS